MRNRYVDDGSSFTEIVEKYGPWTAMSIDLGKYSTRPPAVDKRLNRILQIASAYAPKPLSQCRVLDIACLEGQYAIEFGLHGATAVGVDIRDENLAKSAFAAKELKLDRVEFIKDDVRNLSKAEYGEFDVVIASGIFYHLTAEDACRFLRNIKSLCAGICILDTYVSVNPSTTISFDGIQLSGSHYREHAPDATSEQKASDLWASIDNEVSFWFSEIALIDMLHAAGFTTCCQVLLPTQIDLTRDRRMYLLSAAPQLHAISSRPTSAYSHESASLQDLSKLHPSQVKRSLLFRMLKTYLPVPVKNLMKPWLRKARLLDTSESPF